MFIYKDSIAFKALAILLVCLFAVNDIAWAQPTTLAIHSGMADPELREKAAAMQFLLSADGVNHYIKEQIEKEKGIFGKVWADRRTQVIDVNDPGMRGLARYKVRGLKSIVLVKVAGLFASTGQAAHVGLSGKDYGLRPVIYIDSMLANTPDRCVQKHEIDEILQWESFRANILGLERSEMRKWIVKHAESADEALKGTEYEDLTSRQIAKRFHSNAYRLAPLFEKLKLDTAANTYFDYDYLRNMLSSYGTDEAGGNVNIAASVSPKKTAGSAAECLKTIFYDGLLRYKQDISVRHDLFPRRRKADGASLFVLHTVHYETEILKKLGILIEGAKPNTVRLRPDLRDLPLPEPGSPDPTIEDICDIEVDGIKWLRRYYVPPDKIEGLRAELAGRIMPWEVDAADAKVNLDHFAAPQEAPDESSPKLSKKEASAAGLLTDRDETILRDRRGFNEEGRTLTFKEIGDKLRITKERVRQLELQALGKIRKWIEGQGTGTADLKDGWDAVFGIIKDHMGASVNGETVMEYLNTAVLTEAAARALALEAVRHNLAAGIVILKIAQRYVNEIANRKAKDSIFVNELFAILKGIKDFRFSLDEFFIALGGKEVNYTALVSSHLLGRDFVRYWESLRKIVNPASKGLTVAVGAAGSSVSDAWFATRFARAYFIDEAKITEVKLKKYLAAWSPVDINAPWLANKRKWGFTDSAYLKTMDPEFLVIQELQAMGVRKEDIAVGLDEKSRPKIVFKMPGFDGAREIIFVCRGLLVTGSSLDEELHGKVDVFHQKAAFDLPVKYESYIGRIAEWIKPLGFMMINDYTHYEEFGDIGRFLGGNFKERISREAARVGEKVLAGLITGKRYGWKMTVLQRRSVPKKAKASPARELIDRLKSDRIMKLFENIENLSDEDITGRIRESDRLLGELNDQELRSKLSEKLMILRDDLAAPLKKNISERRDADLGYLTGRSSILWKEGVYFSGKEGDQISSVEFAENVARHVEEEAGRFKAKSGEKFKVLVFGAGTGLDAMTAYHHAGKNGIRDIGIDVIDINTDALRNTRLNFAYMLNIYPYCLAEHGIDLKHAEKERAPLADSYDLILFNAPNAVEVKDDSKWLDTNLKMESGTFKFVMKEIICHLNPGGAALVATDSTKAAMARLCRQAGPAITLTEVKRDGDRALFKIVSAASPAPPTNAVSFMGTAWIGWALEWVAYGIKKFIIWPIVRSFSHEPTEEEAGVNKLIFETGDEDAAKCLAAIKELGRREIPSSRKAEVVKVSSVILNDKLLEDEVANAEEFWNAAAEALAHAGTSKAMKLLEKASRSRHRGISAAARKALKKDTTAALFVPEDRERYPIKLTPLADNVWLAKSAKMGELRLEVKEFTKNIPKNNVEEVRLLLKMAYPAPEDVDNLIKSLLASNDANSTLKLLYHDGRVIGAYHNASDSILGIAVDPQYRGSGAIDVLLADIKGRILNNNDRAKLYSYIGRRSQRAKRGSFEGTLEEFKKALGIKSDVEMVPVGKQSSADMASEVPSANVPVDAGIHMQDSYMGRYGDIQEIIEKLPLLGPGAPDIFSGSKKVVDVGVGGVPIATCELAYSLKAHNPQIEIIGTELPGDAARAHIFMDSYSLDGFRDFIINELKSHRKFSFWKPNDITSLRFVLNDQGIVTSALAGFGHFGVEVEVLTLDVASDLTYVVQGGRKVHPRSHGQALGELYKYVEDTAGPLFRSGKDAAIGIAKIVFDPTERRLETVGAQLVVSNNISKHPKTRNADIIITSFVTRHMTESQRKAFKEEAIPAMLRDGGVYITKESVELNDGGRYRIEIYQKRGSRIVLLGSALSDSERGIYSADGALAKIPWKGKKATSPYLKEMLRLAQSRADSLTPQFQPGDDLAEVRLPPTGRPAQLVREMRDAGMFGAENSKTSEELSGNAMRKGKADSQRTIQRELRVLFTDLELVKKIGTEYYLAGWLAMLVDNQWTELLADLGLNKASPTPEDLKQTRKLIARLRSEVERSTRKEYPALNSSRTAELKALLKRLAYPRKSVPALLKAFNGFFSGIGFARVQLRADSLEEGNTGQLINFLKSLMAPLREPSGKTLSLLKLLVTSFNNGDILKAVIENSTIGDTEKAQNLEGLIGCATRSQLAYILLSLLHIPVEGVIAPSHAIVSIPLGNTAVFVDSALGMVREVDFKEHYRKEGKYRVLKKESRVSPHRLAARRRQLITGSITPTDLAIGEFLHRFYFAVLKTNGNALTAAIHHNLGNIYMSMGNLGHAMREYQKALDLNPDIADTRNNLSNIYVKLGDFNGAIRELRKAIALSPEDSFAYHNLGNAYGYLKKPEKAKRAYQRSLMLNPGSADTHNSLGNVYAALGDFEKARLSFLNAVKLDKRYAIPYYNLGNLYGSRNKLEKAKRAYLKAIHLDHSYAEAYSNLGTVYAGLGDPEKAEKMFRRALKLKPDFAEAHYCIGMLFYASGKERKAVRFWARAVQLNPIFIDNMPAGFKAEVEEIVSKLPLRALPDKNRTMPQGSAIKIKTIAATDGGAAAGTAPAAQTGMRQRFEEMARTYGGKGAWTIILDELRLKIGFNIPKSVYITLPQAWAKFIVANKELVDAGNELVRQDGHELKPETQVKLRKLCRQLVFPRQLRQELNNVVLGLDGRLIVRSSGSFEDSFDHNMAGVFISPVVKDGWTLALERIFADAVEVIWRRNAEARLDGVPDTLSAEEGFGCVVQPFVDFDVSGTAMSNFYGHTSIEAVIGDTRTAVSSPYASTANYLFRKGTKAFEYNPAFLDLPHEFRLKGVEYSVENDREEMLRIVSGYPKIEGKFSPLTLTMARELNRIVNALEEAIGVPVDVEWGIFNNMLYITQVRPIIGDFGKALVQPVVTLAGRRSISRTAVALGRTSEEGITARVVLFGNGVKPEDVLAFEKELGEGYIRVERDVASSVGTLEIGSKARVLVDPSQGSRNAHNVNLIAGRIAAGEFVYCNGPVLREGLFWNLDFMPHPKFERIWVSRQKAAYFSDGLRGVFYEDNAKPDAKQPGMGREEDLVDFHNRMKNLWLRSFNRINGYTGMWDILRKNVFASAGDYMLGMIVMADTATSTDDLKSAIMDGVRKGTIPEHGIFAIQPDIRRLKEALSNPLYPDGRESRVRSVLDNVLKLEEVALELAHEEDAKIKERKPRDDFRIGIFDIHDKYGEIAKVFGQKQGCVVRREEAPEGKQVREKWAEFKKFLKANDHDVDILIIHIGSKDIAGGITEACARAHRMNPKARIIVEGLVPDLSLQVLHKEGVIELVASGKLSVESIMKDVDARYEEARGKPQDREPTKPEKLAALYLEDDDQRLYKAKVFFKANIPSDIEIKFAANVEEALAILDTNNVLAVFLDAAPLAASEELQGRVAAFPLSVIHTFASKKDAYEYVKLYVIPPPDNTIVFSSLKQDLNGFALSKLKDYRDQRVAAYDAAFAEWKATHQQSAQSPKMKLLMVDDDKDLTEDVPIMIKDAVGTQDYEILIANSYTEADKILKDNKIDLIIFDVIMPFLEEEGARDSFYNRLNDIPHIFVLSGAFRNETESVLKQRLNESAVNRANIYIKGTGPLNFFSGKIKEACEKQLQEWYAAHPATAPPANKTEPDKPTLLIIQDTSVQAEDLAGYIRESTGPAVNIITADSIFTLKRALNENRPDIVVFEPTLNGKDELKNIRALAANKNPACLFIIAGESASEVDVALLDTKNVLDLLKTPFYFEEVRKAVLRHWSALAGKQGSADMKGEGRDPQADKEDNGDSAHLSTPQPAASPAAVDEGAISSINTPGLLIHGMNNPGTERLITILREGVKPWEEIADGYKNPYAKPFYSMLVSLSMVPKSGGYEDTSAAVARIGPTSRSDLCGGLAFVIDPAYVKMHPERFLAAGENFKKDKNRFKQYSDESGHILNGIKYAETADSFGLRVHFAVPFYDQVVTRFIPPEAITAVIVKYPRIAEDIKQIFLNNFPERPIRIFGVDGKLLFDMKGRSPALAEKPGSADMAGEAAAPAEIKNFADDSTVVAMAEALNSAGAKTDIGDYREGAENLADAPQKAGFNGEEAPAEVRYMSNFKEIGSEAELVGRIREELLNNQVHAMGAAANLWSRIVKEDGNIGVEMIYIDNGPGIGSVRDALEGDGYTTTNDRSRGKGLRGIKSLALSGGKGYLEVMTGRERYLYCPTELEPFSKATPLKTGTMVRVVRFLSEMRLPAGKPGSADMKGEGSDELSASEYTKTILPLLNKITIKRAVKKILIAEDKQGYRADYEAAFKAFPQFEIVLKANGKDAYEYLEKNRDVDLIITDLFMPVMKGNEFMSKVRNDLAMDIPAIFITSSNVGQAEMAKIGNVTQINKRLFSKDPAGLIAMITDYIKEKEPGSAASPAQADEGAISDINTPGLLVHGAGNFNPERLITILREGIKPWNEIAVEYTEHSLTPPYPMLVSLSMVPERGGYELTSAAAFYGPPSHLGGLDFHGKLTLMVDPAYVKTHPENFIAAGKRFKKDSYGFEYYSDENGHILNGIRHAGTADSLGLAGIGFSRTYDDEVVARFIPPEAIAAVIVKETKVAEEVKQIFLSDFPERSIRIFGVDGKLLFDIKGRSPAAPPNPTGKPGSAVDEAEAWLANDVLQGQPFALATSPAPEAPAAQPQPVRAGWKKAIDSVNPVMAAFDLDGTLAPSSATVSEAPVPDNVCRKIEDLLRSGIKVVVVTGSHWVGWKRPEAAFIPPETTLENRFWKKIDPRLRKDLIVCSDASRIWVFEGENGEPHERDKVVMDEALKKELIGVISDILRENNIEPKDERAVRINQKTGGFTAVVNEKFRTKTPDGLLYKLLSNDARIKAIQQRLAADANPLLITEVADNSFATEFSKASKKILVEKAMGFFGLKEGAQILAFGDSMGENGNDRSMSNIPGSTCIYVGNTDIPPAENIFTASPGPQGTDEVLAYLVPRISVAAPAAQPRPDGVSPSDTSPTASVEAITEGEAERLAQMFDQGLSKYRRALFGWDGTQQRAIENADLKRAKLYSAENGSLVFFYDRPNYQDRPNDLPGGGYLMFLDKKGEMVGYGSWGRNRENYEIDFRFYVFPDKRRQGFGSEFLKRIVFSITNEQPAGAPVRKLVFKKLSELDAAIVQDAMKSDLPEFLMKRGFKAEEDTPYLSNCDFVLYRIPQPAASPALALRSSTESAPESEVGPDIESGVRMLHEKIRAEKKGENLKYYTVRYNAKHIQHGSPAEQLLKTYVEKILPMWMQGKDRIKLTASNSNAQSLISVESYADQGRSKIIGDGHIDIDEDAADKALRIIGMVNMAILASDIPLNDEIDKYKTIIAKIRAQYKAITGSDLPEDGLRDARRKGVWIRLPRAAQVPLERVAEYYRLTTLQLEQSA